MMYQDKKGHSAVFGIFESRSSLESAIEGLKSSGFSNADISVLMPDANGGQNFAHEKGTKAPEGATAGATGGLALGGVLGWLAGIGALAIPGIGPFVAAGPIIGAIAGAGVGGTLGGVAGGLIGFGIPEYEAKRYESYVKNGGILISVHVDDSTEAKRAKEILESAGAKDIDSEMEKGPGFMKSTKTTDLEKRTY